jgi:hypothetical protein
MAMIKGVTKPKELVVGSNTIDLDIFAREQKELA